MRDKEHICAIQAYEDMLLLTTLNYEYEVKDLKAAQELKVPKFEKKELELAEQLINKLTVKKFTMSRFKDTFAQELKKRIEKAAKGKKLEKIKKSTKAPEERNRAFARASAAQKH